MSPNSSIISLTLIVRNENWAITGLSMARSRGCRTQRSNLFGAINTVGAEGREASSYLRHLALYLQDQRQEQLRPI